MIDPNTINDRIRRLRSIKGKGSAAIKKDLLQEYLADPAFLQVTQFTLDSRKHYNVTDLPDFVQSTVGTSLDDALDYLEFLSTKRGCTDFEKDKLITLAGSSKPIYDVVKMILSKTLDCGCGAVSINKARPNTVEIFPYMRCSTISKISNINFPAIVQEKLNGEYIAIIKKDGKILHRTRNGNYLDLKGRFFQQFMECEYDNCVFMGEILALDENGKYMSREASNGIMSKAIHGTLSEEEADSIEIVLWDIVSLDHFNDDDLLGRIIYKTRFERLKHWIDKSNLLHVALVEYKIVDTYEDAVKFFQHMVELGHEGAVLKDFSNIFKNTTSTTQIKLKPVKDADLRLVEWNYGEKDKKYRYCMGSLTFETEDGGIIVDCGSGYTDKQRGYLGKDDNGNVIQGMDIKQRQYWDSQVGKIHELMFSEVCKDKKRPDKDSLYLPIYSEPRPDKFDADTTKHVKSL